MVWMTICILGKKILRSKLEDILAKEEIYWKQKSIELWLKEGDKNTKFFHNNTKSKRSINSITKMHSQGGKILEEKEDITREALEYAILNEEYFA